MLPLCGKNGDATAVYQLGDCAMQSWGLTKFDFRQGPSSQFLPKVLLDGYNVASLGHLEYRIALLPCHHWEAVADK